ncbi:MAG: formate/nitrite transporter family protein [Clostridia bacterium]|nr:formate/nitrite transporter family protein [Clostridia bacterium]
MKNLLKDLLLAVMAGLSISIGCIAFLSSGDKAIGAAAFAVGLFMVVNFKFNLFTGKVCYSLDNKPSYILRLLIIWVGNLIGALAVAGLMRLTRFDGLIETCKTIVAAKLGGSYLSSFVLGIFCNILIYLAVHGYSRFENSVAKFAALFFGVFIFVFCGFEHCVADMFYLAFAGSFTAESLFFLLFVTLGNIVGGLLLPAVDKLVNLK